MLRLISRTKFFEYDGNKETWSFLVLALRHIDLTNRIVPYSSMGNAYIT